MIRPHSMSVLARMMILLMVTMLFAGCSRSPNVRHFMLGVTAKAGADSSEDPVIDREDSKISILVGPIRLPRYLDRPQIARRKKGGEVKLDEFNRWLGGFETNLTTALAADIRSRVGSPRVVAYPSSPPFQVDYSIRIHVDEWIVDESNDLRVHLRWAIEDRKGTGEPQMSSFKTLVELDGRSTAALVEAHDKVISELSRELVNELNTDDTDL